MNTILIISYFNSCKKKFCQANAIQTAFICYSSVKKTFKIAVIAMRMNKTSCIIQVDL